MRSSLRLSLAAAATALFASGADAQITVYTSQSSFLAAVTGAQVDTYSDLSEQLYSSPLSRSAGAYTYQVSAPNDLFMGSNSGNIFMSTNTSTNPLTFSNFSPSASAIGGFFFGSNINGDFTPSVKITILVTDTLGNLTEVILNPTTSSFRGFTSTSTFSSMVVTSDNGPNTFVWPGVDNLTLATAGQVAAVPEPGTWAMMLLGFGAIGFSMRWRRRAAHFAQAA